MTIGVVVAVLALAVLAAWAMLVFNRLVRLRNQVRTAWADIDVQLQRRHDLVPQLVSAVKGYAGHEQALMESVTTLRAQAMAQSSPAQLGAIESALQEGVGRLVALVESYPDLKASDNFRQLQHELVDVEDQLQYARRFYNGEVRDYDNGIQRFPEMVVAGSFGFRGAEYFQAAEADRAPVRVDLGR
ncbi:MAG: LemA family protein [Luteimonas sp.]